MGANKPVAPASLLQVGGAGRVVGKKSLELWERLWEPKIATLVNVHEHGRTLPLVAVGDNRIGKVHSAHYWRKPRGRPCRLGREHDRRFSFCCAVDGCRSRATPPSLRFLGPKVYIAAIVVLIAILRHGATALRTRELTEVIGVDRRTVERWRLRRSTPTGSVRSFRAR